MLVNPSTLYLVATPIGHIRDITLRALDVLGSVDTILCEDTRVTQKLLTAHGLKGRLLQYHDRNGEAQRPKVLGLLQQGQSLALVSDAGAPLVSDPGYKLVQEVREAGFKVESLPGACAVITALQLSGLPSERFLFGGFLPRKAGEIKALLEQYRPLQVTLLFFESPNRLLDTLEILQEVLPEAEVVVARELTKRFEEIARGTPEALHRDFAGRAEGVLGEMVLGLRLPPPKSASEEEVKAALREALTQMRVKDAAQLVAEKFGLPRSQVYALALETKKT